MVRDTNHGADCAPVRCRCLMRALVLCLVVLCLVRMALGAAAGQESFSVAGGRRASIDGGGAAQRYHSLAPGPRTGRAPHHPHGRPGVRSGQSRPFRAGIRRGPYVGTGGRDQGAAAGWGTMPGPSPSRSSRTTRVGALTPRRARQRSSIGISDGTNSTSSRCVWPLLLSLRKQYEQREMRAQKVILQGPVSRPPTPVAHSCAPLRRAAISQKRSAPSWERKTPRSSGGASPYGCRVGLVVVKGHGKTVHKGQHFPFWANKRSSRFFGGLCLTRPRFLGCSAANTGGGLAASPPQSPDRSA